MNTDDRAPYRELIDRLVESCRHGQGQIQPENVRNGTWNVNAGPEHRAMRDLVRRLPQSDRYLVANMLTDAYVGGVHDTLAILYDAEIAPFDNPYEGTPYHDFIGRLDDWEWPA